MADPKLRDLERALASGDPGARPALAAACLRAGRALQAIAVLQGGPPSAQEADAWGRALGQLTVSAKGRGARPVSGLVGWFGSEEEPGRYAALESPAGLVVFDRAGPTFVSARVAPPQLLPHATGGDCLFAARNTQLVALQATARGLELKTLPLPRLGAGLVRCAPDSAERIVLQRPIPGARIRCDVYEPFDGTLGRTVTGALLGLDWARDRMLWTAGGALRFAPISTTTPAQAVAFAELDDASLQPLTDGRVLIAGQPTRLLDLEHLSPHGVVTHERLFPPFRLSHDGEDLLCVARGRPARLPLRGSAQPRIRVAEAGAFVVWHPRADVAATYGPGLQTELLSFAPGAARGRVLLRFPLGLRPLGWTPEGTGLLMARELSDAAARVELWTCPGDPS